MTKLNLTEKTRQNRVETELRKTIDRLSIELNSIDQEMINQQEKVDKVQSEICKVTDAARIDMVSNSKCLNKLQTEKDRLHIELEKVTAMEEKLRVKVASLEEEFEAQKKRLLQTYSQDSVQSGEGVMLFQGRGHGDNYDSRLRYSWTSDDQSQTTSFILSSSLEIPKSNITSLNSFIEKLK